jgi:hypothetical protein
MSGPDIILAGDYTDIESMKCRRTRDFRSNDVYNSNGNAQMPTGPKREDRVQAHMRRIQRGLIR